MDFSQVSKNKIVEKLQIQHTNTDKISDPIRVLFVPVKINQDTFAQSARLYGQVYGKTYETVVIVETVQKDIDKKISLPSLQHFETPFGKVPVNDILRNEFCDEDDDFFINDEVLSPGRSVYDQLPMLQSALNPFSVVSVQISDEEPDIIRELSMVFDELLLPRNVLILFCCQLHGQFQDEFSTIKKLSQKEQDSYLFNFLKTEGNRIDGAGSLIAGLHLSKIWELNISFLNGQYAARNSPNLISGFARQTKPRVAI